MDLSNNTDLKQNLLKKHVNAIHCTNNLSLVQRKIFNAFLLNAYYDLPTKSQYEISMRKLCEMIGYDSRDYKKLKKSLLDLISTVIEWSIVDNTSRVIDEKWRASSIISAAKIENGICTYEFSTIMREILYRPEIYGKIDLKVMIEFESGYALALYENCVRFQGVSQTPWFSTNTFRKLMGVSEKSYLNFSDLKKRVLDIAIKEVNRYSPITLTPEINRVNKQVTAIRFKLTHKKNLLDANDPVVLSLKTHFSFSEVGLKNILAQYDKNYIQEKIDLIKKSDSFKQGKIRELSAYLIDALKRDYKPKNLINSNKEEEKKPYTLSVPVKRDEENDRRRKIVDQYVDGLNPEEKNLLIANFDSHLKEKDSFYLYQRFQKSGLKTVSVRAVFTVFVSALLKVV